MPCRHHQNLYVDTCRRMIHLAMEKVIRNLRVFVNYWALDDLMVRPDERMKRTVRLRLLSMRKDLGLDSEWFVEYMAEH